MTINSFSVLYLTPRKFFSTAVVKEELALQVNNQTKNIKIQGIDKKGWQFLKSRPLTGAVAVGQLLALAVVLLTIFSPAAVSARESMGNASPPAVVDEVINGKSFSVSKITINARPDQVYKVLTDYQNVCKVFPQMKSCTVLSEHGNTKVLHHKVSPLGLPGTTYNYDVEVKETPGKCLEWHRVAGDLKQVDGFWRLDPLEGGRYTEVTYSSYVNGGFFMPQVFVKRQCRIDMPQVLTHLKTETELNSVRLAKKPDGAISQ